MYDKLQIYKLTGLKSKASPDKLKWVRNRKIGLKHYENKRGGRKREIRIYNFFKERRYNLFLK